MKVEEKNRYDNDKWGKVVSIYKDEAYSGKNTDRPEFQRMIADVKAKKINTVLVTELSRLSRSVTDFLHFIKELEDYGCDFICLQYDFDTTSPAGKVFMTIIMALAQFERELTAERIKNNFHARALRGLSNGGTPFLGYDKDPVNSGQLLLNKDESLIVKEIYDYFIEIGKISEVVKLLTKKGIRNKGWIAKDGKPRGNKTFTHDSVWRILTNTAYIGKREINKANKDADPKELKFEERYQQVDASWKPILDESTFSDVQKKLQLNKKVKTAPKHDYILSGLLVCDECGKALFGQSANGRGGKHYYYGHKGKSTCKMKRYSASQLESVIKKQMFSFLNNKSMNEQFKEAVAELSLSRPQTNKALLELKSKEIKELKSEIDRLMNLITSNELATGLDAILERMGNNEKHVKVLETERESLEQKALMETENNVDEDFILKGIKKLRSERFRKSNLASKRDITRSVIKSVHIHPDNVIKIDFWGSDEQSEPLREASRRQKGVVLPFRKLGRPLEASFSMGSSNGEKYSEIKKAVGMGTYVLDSNGFFNDLNNVSTSAVCRTVVRAVLEVVEATGIEPATF